MTGQSVKKAFDKFWFHLAGTQLMFPNQRSGPSAGAQEIGFKSPGFSQGYSQFDAFSVLPTSSNTSLPNIAQVS